MHDLPGSKRSSQGDADSLPLHAKAVTGTIDYAGLSRLPYATEVVRENARLALEWTYDPTRYEALLATGRCRNNRSQCRIPDPDVEIMVALRKYEAAERAQIRAVGIGFTVPEWAKKRRRAVYEPYINDCFTNVPTVAFRTRDTRLRLLRKFTNGWAAAIDLAAYYDQFALSPAVRPYFGLQTKAGFLQATTLPMGFRPSCAVAQWVTWLLVDLPPQADVEIMTYIDNIMVVSRTPEGVKRTMATIIARCKQVGVVINDVDQPCNPVQKIEFLGELIDFKQGTVALAAKTVEKLKVVQAWASTVNSSRREWVIVPATNRQVTATVSLLLFAADVLDISTLDFYHTMQMYRLACHIGSLGGWESKHATIRTATWNNLMAWLSKAISNTPRPLPADAPSKPHDKIIFVDACATGWGAVTISNGMAHVTSGPWPEHLAPHMKSSVSAEPEAMVRAVFAATDACTKRILVVSDHQPLVYAAAKPHRAARAWAYNHALWRLHKHLPGVHIDVAFIQGHLNPGDKPSRGARMTTEDFKQLSEQVEKFTTENKSENGKTGKSPEWAQTALNPIRHRHLSHKTSFG